MLHAIEVGLVQASVAELSPSYTQTHISRDEMSRILESRNRWIPTEDAARMLGVSNAVLRDTLARMLEVDPQWRKNPLKIGAVDKRSAEHLIERHMPHTREGDLIGCVPLRDLTARRVGDGKALIRLYEAIRDEQIKPVGLGAGGKFGDLMFGRDQVAEYVGSFSLTASVTMTQLASLTGWKYESIAHWADLGLLPTTRCTLRGQGARTIPVASLVAFMREYLLVADLARLVGSNPKQKSKVLDTKGIRIVGQKVSAATVRRGGIVRNDELLRAVWRSSGR